MKLFLTCVFLPLKSFKPLKSSNFLIFFKSLQKVSKASCLTRFLVQPPQNTQKDYCIPIENLFLYEILQFVSMKNKMLSRYQASRKAWSFRFLKSISFSDIIRELGLSNLARISSQVQRHPVDFIMEEQIPARKSQRD